MHIPELKRWKFLAFFAQFIFHTFALQTQPISFLSTLRSFFIFFRYILDCIRDFMWYIDCNVCSLPLTALWTSSQFYAIKVQCHWNICMTQLLKRVRKRKWEGDKENRERVFFTWWQPNFKFTSKNAIKMFSMNK